MSQPDDRSAGTPHGSTAFTPLPGQPLAEQPTEVVHRPDDPGWGSQQQDTEVLGVPDRQPDAPRFWERDSDDEPADDRATGYAGPGGPTTAPDYRDAPVVVRCADSVAGLLLLLAGIAAGVSLLVVWVNGGATGLDLVRAGFDDLTGDPQRLTDRDTWQPLAVVLGGAALFVLGLLLFVPARTHRFLGAVALLVTLVVAAGVLVPLAEADWDLQRWAVGAWFTVAVAVLGFLGSLKALMTNPRRR